MTRSWIRLFFVYLLSFCVPLSTVAESAASASTENEFVPYTTEAFEKYVAELSSAEEPQEILAYDPDLGESQDVTLLRTEQLNAMYPEAVVVVIPAREKLHAMISDSPRAAGSLPNQSTRVVTSGPQGILEADIAANIGALLDVAPPSSVLRKAARGVAAIFGVGPCIVHCGVPWTYAKPDTREP